MRRKSSSFRPHNWKYPSVSVHRDNISVEQLPIVILEHIFDHLQTSDLLRVCVASKYFYLPAANRLYLKIIITGDELALSYAKRQLSHWNRNYGTAIRPEKISALLDVVLDNDKLAEIIHSVTVSATEDIALLPKLLSCLRLKEFYYQKPMRLPTRLALNAHSLTVHLSDKLCAPYLRELKLCHENTNQDSQTYHSLATFMIRNNSYQNLRRLVFESNEDRDLRRINRHNQMTSELASSQASWIGFFAAFAENNIKLNLLALGLEGFLKDAGTDIVALLRRAVNVAELSTLQLHCKELSHAHASHNDDNRTLLEELTRHTPSLKNLEVRPSDNCLTCQTNSIVSALASNLPNQLEQLLLEFESPTMSVSQSIRLTILEKQQNLQRLRLVDRARLGEEQRMLYKNLSHEDISLWEHGSFYALTIKKALLPSLFEFVFDPMQFVTDPMLRCVEECKRQIAEFLDTDLIYTGAKVHLPKLREYSLSELTINMMENGICVNGQVIGME